MDPSPQKNPQRPRDVRPAALALTLLGTVGIGLLTGGGGPTESHWQRASHMPPVSQHLPLRVRQLQANEARQRFQQGVVMLHAKQYEHALVAFHSVLALDPRSADAYVNAGFALLGLQRPREAVDFFTGAIDLRTDQMNAYFGLGVALEAIGDLEGAVGAMRTFAHRAKPGDPFQRKAWGALWEWESKLREQREKPPVAAAPAKP